MTNEEILNLPMQDNDSGADTVRGYFHALLTTLWNEEESFSGKRPFGNSGWSRDLAKPLVLAGVVPGELDSDGYIDNYDDDELNAVVFSLIDTLCGMPS